VRAGLVLRDVGCAPGVGVAYGGGGGRNGAAGRRTSLFAAGVAGAPPSCNAVIPISSRPATAAQNTTAEPLRSFLNPALNS
jgi:hypothetical protein